MNIRHYFVALLLVSIAAPRLVHAAQSYDNCAGTISSLPTTISTQGVWCLKKDLATSIASGNAITIATNNVTIDCNDFKLGGLAAGNASWAYGIYAFDRQNITVRHCNIRGFYEGIYFSSGAGHLVEDNRLDNNLAVGIDISSANTRVHHNAVYDTGGKDNFQYAFGIEASADITDNTVSGLFVTAGGGKIAGITANGSDNQVLDNIVSGFNLTGTVDGIAVPGAIGIESVGPTMTIANNHIFGADKTVGYGIKGNSVSTNFCLGNTVTGFYYGIDGCNSSGNMLAGNTVNEGVSP